MMGTRGRKPTPTALRIIKGNPGKRPLPKNEPKPPPMEDLTPPAFLSASSKAEWKRVAPVLQRNGVLTELDRAALAAYCQAFGRWVEAERAVAAMAKAAREVPRDEDAPAGAEQLAPGLLVGGSRGQGIVANPLVRISQQARADVVRFAAEFGMTPAARSRVQGKPPEDDDEEAEFFRTG